LPVSLGFEHPVVPDPAPVHFLPCKTAKSRLFLILKSPVEKAVGKEKMVPLPVRPVPVGKMSVEGNVKTVNVGNEVVESSEVFVTVIVEVLV